MQDRLKQWARTLKADVLTLWFAYKHPDTPLLAKALALAAAAYALSPIDLIPDFIPVLGYLDDVIILPVMIYFAVRLLPDPVLQECRQRSAEWLEARRGKPRSMGGAVAIVIIWIIVAVWAVWAFIG